jgi:hypothetical protein
MTERKKRRPRVLVPQDDRRDKRLVVYVEKWLIDWLAEQAEERDETVSAARPSAAFRVDGRVTPC